MDAALRLRGVRYAYPGGAAVLDGVDLDVPRGRLVVLMGPNGSGKTTLLRIAAGLAAPDGGAATLGDASAQAASRRGRIGYIPQHLGLVRHATALDNALMGRLRSSGARALLGIHPRDARDRAEAALDAVGLREKAHERVCDLSGGERQRVALARTLAQDPDVIVADELIANLDAVRSHAALELLRERKRRGTALLVSLHHIDVALANADLVAFLARGRISRPRAPEEITPEDARCAVADA